MSKDINLPKTIKRLTGRYCRGKATPEEAEFLDKYYSYFDKKDNISDSLSTEEIVQIEERVLRNIMSEIDTKSGTNSDIKNQSFIFKKSFRYAAAVIFAVLGISALLIMENNPFTGVVADKGNETYAQRDPVSITRIGDHVKSSQLADINSKTKGPATTGISSQKERVEEVVIKTITTPRGGEYRITLPDGTRVRMNAASSIEYPSKFGDNARRINVSGEVYLEVQKDAKKPFIVKVNNSTEIKVLGTHFNISAYPEEKVIKTTLIEGSVQVTNSTGLSVNLSPGQQSTTDDQGNISVKKANIEEVMAWVNGIFQFNSLSVDEIMRQISRWYDVEIIYHSNKPVGKYSGIVNRNTTLPEVLNMLELSGIICRIDGDSVIVI